MFAFRDMVVVESPELATTFPAYHTFLMCISGIVTYAEGATQLDK
jgi:hypothetical protein